MSSPSRTPTIFTLKPAPTIFIFCALQCEAKPLIQAWRLKKITQPGIPFSIFTDSQRMIVISGIGKTAMAGAVGYTMALFAATAPIMLNIGIAGHASEPLGTLCLGHKIVDDEAGKVFYPQLPLAISSPTHIVTTYAKPHADYSADGLFDMEASGFYEMAVKFGSSELTQVLKIVSDNSRTSIAAINEALVEQWITKQQTSIEDLLTRLSALKQQLKPIESVLYAQLLNEFRFTVSDGLKLRSLLQRWQVLIGDEAPNWQSQRIKSGKEFLIWLEKQLDEAAFFL